MGVHGPIPERSDQRVRRNKYENGEIAKLPSKGPVKVPSLGMPDAHPIVKALYRSLADSAQSDFYQPSDWEFARYTLHFADQLLKSSRPSAQMLASVNQMLASLLLSEGDRRRVRIEVERNQSGTGGEVVDVAELFRQKMLAGSRQTS